MATPILSFNTNETINGLEPSRLIDLFVHHPPEGFTSWQNSDGVVGFDADFDILTTAPDLQKKLKKLPFGKRLNRLLVWRTAFVGSTVSEYARLPDKPLLPAQLANALVEARGERFPLLIVKDLPKASPLLSQQENKWSAHFTLACEQAGFVLVDGQALAYLPIDFDSIETYLGRLSYSKRKDLRRKLRSRSKLDINTLSTGDAYFQDPATQRLYYALYEAVYDQSELRFDKLTPAYFNSLLSDTQCPGVVMEYRHEGQVIGFNLCYLHDNNLVDKYIGMAYPDARKLNLYFISWVVNLEYALANGCDNYIAGWTDPKIKSHLGARFTPTQHAVYARNRFVRWILKRMTRSFEQDRRWTTPSKKSKRPL